MEIAIWLLAGMGIGWLTAYFMESRREKHYMEDIVLGITGALLGGGIMYLSGVTGPALLGIFDAYALLIALFGSLFAIWGGKIISTWGQSQRV